MSTSSDTSLATTCVMSCRPPWRQGRARARGEGERGPNPTSPLAAPVCGARALPSKRTSQCLSCSSMRRIASCLRSSMLRLQRWPARWRTRGSYTCEDRAGQCAGYAQGPQARPEEQLVWVGPQVPPHQAPSKMIIKRLRLNKITLMGYKQQKSRRTWRRTRGRHWRPQLGWGGSRALPRCAVRILQIARYLGEGKRGTVLKTEGCVAHARS